MRTLGTLVTALGVVLASGGPLHADGPVVQDQSDRRSIGEGIRSIMNQVVAIDFELATTTRLTRATVWLVDNEDDDDGTLGSFSGTVGWGVYTDASNEPGSLLQSGRSVLLTQRDTGLDAFSDDIVAVTFDLEPPLRLAPGSYWFAIKEGPWGVAGDFTNVFWHYAAATYGETSRSADDETSPGSWSTDTSDLMCVLYGEVAAWDQGGVVAGDDGSNLSSSVAANEFVLGSPASVSALDLWLGDNTANDNGVVDDFAGTLSWSIYSDSSGEPGSILTTGQDPAPQLVDTGLQDVVGSDVVRARVRFGRSVSLAAGTYWLALHEGAWGSPTDGDPIYWVFSPSVVGHGNATATDEENPVSWSVAVTNDSAFVLFEELIFASGFESGKACAWSNSSNSSVPCS